MPKIIIRFYWAVGTLHPTNDLTLFYSITYTDCGSVIASQLYIMTDDGDYISEWVVTLVIVFIPVMRYTLHKKTQVSWYAYVVISFFILLQLVGDPLCLHTIV